MVTSNLIRYSGVRRLESAKDLDFSSDIQTAIHFAPWTEMSGSFNLLKLRPFFVNSLNNSFMINEKSFSVQPEI